MCFQLVAYKSAISSSWAATVGRSPGNGMRLTDGVKLSSAMSSLSRPAWAQPGPIVLKSLNLSAVKGAHVLVEHLPAKV